MPFCAIVLSLVWSCLYLIFILSCLCVCEASCAGWVLRLWHPVDFFSGRCLAFLSCLSCVCFAFVLCCFVFAFVASFWSLCLVLFLRLALSCRAVSCLTLPSLYLLSSYFCLYICVVFVLFYVLSSCLVLCSCLVFSCLVLSSFVVLSCLALFCRVVSCVVSSCLYLTLSFLLSGPGRFEPTFGCPVTGMSLQEMVDIGITIYRMSFEGNEVILSLILTLNQHPSPSPKP
jgi:hypothetical protein